ncbi:MAG: amino acid ABC transporter permease [Clostridia bacterium]|nr:amino acid ABC transporter permease [Clostridia bacterium]
MSKKWSKFLDAFIDHKMYEVVLEGLRNTIVIAVAGLLIGILVGTIIASIRIMPKYKKSAKILDKIAYAYVSFFRGTPIVVQLLLGYYVLFPLMGIHLSPLVTCILIFGLNSSAYTSEIMRAGMDSVDKGQLEAARALGMGYWPSMLRVVIPQAIKNILPTLGNEFISLIKETSVVSFVTAMDIYTAFQKIGGQNYEYIIPYLVMAAIYIILVLGIGALIKLMERSLKKSDRN